MKQAVIGYKLYHRTSSKQEKHLIVYLSNECGPEQANAFRL